jgi:hypothetical protein
MEEKRAARASLISEKITGGAYPIAKNHIMGSGSSELGLVEGTRDLLYFVRRFASRCGLRRLKPSAPTPRNKPVLFHHSHGGIGCGSTHKPFFASLKSFHPSPKTEYIDICTV